MLAAAADGGFQRARQSPADSEETSSSLEANIWIMGLRRFGNGRIGRMRGEPEEPSPFASSSGSEASEEESESDRVDDESLVSLPRLPEEEVDELEIEDDLLVGGRCSKTPSPKF